MAQQPILKVISQKDVGIPLHRGYNIKVHRLQPTKPESIEPWDRRVNQLSDALERSLNPQALIAVVESLNNIDTSLKTLVSFAQLKEETDPEIKKCLIWARELLGEQRRSRSSYIQDQRKWRDRLSDFCMYEVSTFLDTISNLNLNCLSTLESQVRPLAIVIAKGIKNVE